MKPNKRIYAKIGFIDYSFGLKFFAVPTDIDSYINTLGTGSQPGNRIESK
jgi:hypothetical protein